MLRFLIRKCWCNSSITCFLVLLRLLRVKNCKYVMKATSIRRKAFQSVKQTVCIVGEKRYKEWRCFC